MRRFGIDATRSTTRRLRRFGARVREDGPAAALRSLRHGSRPPQASFELRTERLTIRLLEERDVATMVRYRNVDGMALYQDWQVPYTREAAQKLVERAARLGGPAPGEWVQLALDHDGELIGDLAIWLDDAGLVGEIGITIAPEYHADGYASETAIAALDWFFSEGRVHRVQVSIDPRNMGSAVALDRLGFEYVGTIRSGHHVRGEWVDDARFSLLEDDWRASRARGAQPASAVDLAELTPEAIRDLSAITPRFLRRDTQARAAIALAAALVPPTETAGPVPTSVRAIVADGEPVGYLVVAETMGGGSPPNLWRIVIDYRHGDRGIEKRAVEELARHYRAAGHTYLDAYYETSRPSGLGSTYRSLGFVPIGQHGEGEVARLDLSTLPD